MSALPESILTRFRSVALERLEKIEAGWNELTRCPDDDCLLCRDSIAGGPIETHRLSAQA